MLTTRKDLSAIGARQLSGILFHLFVHELGDGLHDIECLVQYGQMLLRGGLLQVLHDATMNVSPCEGIGS